MSHIRTGCACSYERFSRLRSAGTEPHQASEGIRGIPGSGLRYGSALSTSLGSFRKSVAWEAPYAEA